MNAIELLESDHAEVKKLLQELVETTDRARKKRSQLLERIERELRVHTRIEEEIFYPAFREAGESNEDERSYFEAVEEHRAVEKLVLPDLRKTDPESSSFGGRAKVLRELVVHHAEEEEEELFPRAQDLLGKESLDRLGVEMQERKRALQKELS